MPPRTPGFEPASGQSAPGAVVGQDVSSPGEFLAGFKSSLFEETIFVLTPQGKIIDLPKDATPIDFAYTRAQRSQASLPRRRVDSVMVALNTPLKNGQRIEIHQQSGGRPVAHSLEPGKRLYPQQPRTQARCANGSIPRVAGETLTHGRFGCRERILQRRPDRRSILDKLSHRSRPEVAGRLFRRRGTGRGQQPDLRHRHIRKASGQPARGAAETAAWRCTPANSRAKGGGGGILGGRVDKLMAGARQSAQTRAARSDCWIRHAPEGHHDPPRRLQQCSG